MTEKENPNPTIHTTHKRSDPSHSSVAPSLGSSAIHRYHLCSPSPSNSSRHQEYIAPAYENNAIPDEFASSWGSITAEDRSVALALSAAAHSSANPSTNTSAPSKLTAEPESTKLDLLQKAGFALFRPQRIQRQCRAICYPSYFPSAHKKRPLSEEEQI